MSSPLARQRRSAARHAVISLHQRLSHSPRIGILSRKISDIIDSRNREAGSILCLDVGCGDMSLAEAVASQCPATSWTCIDVYELPEGLRDAVRWAKYRTFDGEHLPFPDRSMDVVLFCDVLHHAGEAAAERLLREAGRVGNMVIVKDHLEYSWCSRSLLMAMDFLGNWGYGVPLPKRYFTVQGFKDVAAAAGLAPVVLDIGIDLYSHLPLVRRVIRPEWQFMAVLESSPVLTKG